MAPRNNKNKMIDEAECSAAANKMKRSENLHGMKGLMFRSDRFRHLFQRKK
ncbi:hypothetical protein HanRHA438_Chr12g0573731 [Helianthus annuus]|nr:hypothetical protein HanRHA438_Chr12g0573731 [Helianthus annuus]